MNNNIYEPTGTIGEAYGISAANRLRAEVQERKLAPERRKFLNKLAAERAWPNDFGGYFRAESRVEKPCKPLSPRERFVRLVAHFQSFAQTMRQRATENHKPGKRPKFVMTRLLGKVTPIPLQRWHEIRARREIEKVAAA